MITAKNPIIAILMERDGLTFAEAYKALKEAARSIRTGADPEEVMARCFGLELDYIYDLMEVL
jgi:protein-tyrosine phosphatase